MLHMLGPTCFALYRHCEFLQYLNCPQPNTHAVSQWRHFWTAAEMTSWCDVTHSVNSRYYSTQAHILFLSAMSV